MGDEYKCVKEGEIAVLKSEVKTLFKRLDDMKDLKDSIHSLDKNYTVQTELLKNIVEHNKRQDERMDGQEQRIREQQEVIVKINTNLTELNEGQKTLNKRVGKLEDKVNENDDLHKVDTRQIEKNKYTAVIMKIAVPSGVAIILLLELINFFK